LAKTAVRTAIRRGDAGTVDEVRAILRRARREILELGRSRT